MKRVLFSLMALAAVLSVAGAGSFAYFSDTETSTGNTFTAGTWPIEVEIDIKPDEEGVIPVAILTTDEFDASLVDGETVRFGPLGAWAENWALEYVDDDDQEDMILHFDTEETGIWADDTEATLTGETVEGVKISGTDSVRIVPPKNKG